MFNKSNLLHLKVDAIAPKAKFCIRYNVFWIFMKKTHPVFTRAVIAWWLFWRLSVVGFLKIFASCSMKLTPMIWTFFSLMILKATNHFNYFWNFSCRTCEISLIRKKAKYLNQSTFKLDVSENRNYPLELELITRLPQEMPALSRDFP